MNWHVGAVQSIQTRRIFPNPPDAKVISMDFHSTSENLVVAYDNGHIIVHDIIQDRQVSMSRVSKLGPYLVRYSHHKNCAILAEADNAVRVLSFHDNSYRSEHIGHKAKINSMSIFPNINGFITASSDNHVMLWDYRVRNPVSSLNCGAGTSPMADADQQGIIFGVLVSNAKRDASAVKLYDPRKIGPPFVTSEILRHPNTTCSQMQFSPDGDSIYVSTNSEYLFDVESRLGKLVPSFSGFSQHCGTSRIDTSPDQIILAALCNEKSLCFWDLKREVTYNAPFHTLSSFLPGNNKETVRNFKFSRTHHAIVVGGDRAWYLLQ
jgi:COMPASS component SWD2